MFGLTDKITASYSDHSEDSDQIMHKYPISILELFKIHCFLATFLSVRQKVQIFFVDFLFSLSNLSQRRQNIPRFLFVESRNGHTWVILLCWFLQLKDLFYNVNSQTRIFFINI